MKTEMPVLLLCAAASLGGCGGHSAAREAQRPAGNVAIGENGVPVAAASPARRPHVDPRVLPSAFQGHWGLTAADCDASRPDAPGLMKIHGSAIDFHDATEKVRALERNGGYTVHVLLDVTGRAGPGSGAGSGAGQRRETLALALGGTRIVRTTPRGTARYERC